MLRLLGIAASHAILQEDVGLSAFRIVDFFLDLEKMTSYSSVQCGQMFFFLTLQQRSSSTQITEFFLKALNGRGATINRDTPWKHRNCGVSEAVS